MEDIFSNKIETGDIVVYAKREGTKQTMNFGIVIDNNRRFGRDFRIAIKPTKVLNTRANMYKMTGEQAVVMPNQVWAIKNTSSLPPKLVEVLQNSFSVYFSQKESAATRKKENEGLTATERYLKNVRRSMKVNIYSQIEDDIEIGRT